MHRSLSVRSSTRLSRSQLAGSLLLALGLPSAVLADTAPSSPPKADIEITVAENAVQGTETLGKNTFDSQDIKRQLGSSVDLNLITRSVAGVQFDKGAGQLSENSVLDLRPSRLSISGSRPYENSFRLEGLNTTSVLDSTNTSMHIYAEVVGHPQTGFINPGLVDSVEIYTSDISAEYGGFLGGVVSAKLRDPRMRFGFSASYAQTSDGWTRFLIDPADASATLPEKMRFDRSTSDYSVDLPLSKTSSVLIAYARATATLENTQRMAAFGVFDTRAHTLNENVTVKYLKKFSPESTLRFTSLFSPYEQENYEQSPKFQDNDALVNKFEFTHKTSEHLLEAVVGYSWHSSDRQQEPNLYTYKYMGSIDWVAPTSTSAQKGGNGNMISRQTDLPVSLKAEQNLWTGAKLGAGLEYVYTTARKARPETNSAYRHQTSSTAKLDPRVVSADGPDDLTVITGEQALNYRLVYYAFDTHTNLGTLSAWSQLSDHGKILGLPWNYRAGLRYEKNNFLKNDDVAPRLSAQIAPLGWLKFNAGFNRYYSNTLLSYKLREGYPANYNYVRTGKLNSAGKLVFSNADWVLASQTKTSGYAAGGLNTPYSDEISLGAKFDLKLFGSFDVDYIKRLNREELTRDVGTLTTYVKDDGSVVTYKLYRPANNGYTNYKAWSFSWNKRLKNHRFVANATFSDTKTSTVAGDSDPDYWDGYSDSTMNDQVYYNGQVRIRRDIALDRSNFARPSYINFIWSSDWFKRRLKIDLLGRYNLPFNRIDQNGTITVNGAKYDFYEKVRIPSNLVTDLNLAWVAWQSERTGSVEFTLKASNLFNRLPYSENATTSDPYQLGRSFWAGVRYNF